MATRGNFVLEEPYRDVLQTSDGSLALDTTIIVPVSGIWVNSAGDVSVVLASGKTTVFKLAASSGLNIEFTRINASGTTVAAADIRVLVR